MIHMGEVSGCELSESWAEDLVSVVGLPRLLSCERKSATSIRIVVDITSDLTWFRGHFPSNPILPGIVQLHWAVKVCRAVFAFPDALSEVHRLKFSRIVMPPLELELNVSRRSEREAFFGFTSRDERHSEGKLVFSGTA